jgi:hypothetical protein
MNIDQTQAATAVAVVVVQCVVHALISSYGATLIFTPALQSVL